MSIQAYVFRPAASIASGPMRLELAMDLSGMERFEPVLDLKVLVACDRYQDAQEACALLEGIARQNAAEGRLLYRWWNFEVLAIPGLRKLAAREADEANLIMIAAQDGPELPEPVIDWISQWLAISVYTLRALIALIDLAATKSGGSPGLLSQLRKVADLGQMDFFAQGTEAK